jgi:peptidyl-prolyl cis-trans isomerase SurA
MEHDMKVRSHESHDTLMENSARKSERRETPEYGLQGVGPDSHPVASRRTSHTELKILLKMAVQTRSISLWVVFALLVRSPAIGTEVIDRIVAVVNQQVITLGDVEEEKKFQDLDLVADTLAGGGEKTEKLIQSEIIHTLIRQRLIRDQVLSFPGSEVSSTEIDKQMEALEQKWGGEQELRKMLAADHISWDELKQRLEWQMRVLKFLDNRFRQFVVVEPKEIEDYYTKEFLPELAKRRETAPPPLAQVQEQIRQILTEEEINVEVNSWLKILTQSATIEIFG